LLWVSLWVRIVALQRFGSLTQYILNRNP
jgi:hypothetical protein